MLLFAIKRDEGQFACTNVIKLSRNLLKNKIIKLVITPTNEKCRYIQWIPISL
jgi:hypothetical protein